MLQEKTEPTFDLACRPAAVVKDRTGPGNVKVGFDRHIARR